MTDEQLPSPPRELASEIKCEVPHSARIWNYWMGGKDNYPVDRAAGDAFAKVYPDIVVMARQSRQFLIRTVRYLVGEAGIRQFLDIGTGLPTMQNTHEVAQQIAPESRIVYVDNDPLVLAHARALLVNTTPEGVTTYIDSDVHHPDLIIADARNVLNFTQPVAVMFMGILGHVAEFDELRSIVARVMAAVPSGSTSYCTTVPIPAGPTSRPSRSTPPPEPFHTTRAASSRSASVSRAWRWWSPVWCRSRNGDRTSPR